LAFIFLILPALAQAEASLEELLSERHFRGTLSDVSKLSDSDDSLALKLVELCSSEMPFVQKRAAQLLIQMSDRKVAQDKILELLAKEEGMEGLPVLLSLSIDQVPTDNFRVSLAKVLLNPQSSNGKELTKLSSKVGMNPAESLSFVKEFLAQSGDENVRALVNNN